jgi:hypothetical protein
LRCTSRAYLRLMSNVNRLMNTPSPRDSLFAGVEILSAVLLPHGFVFAFRDEGHGSGGSSARGEYVRADRRLQLHYRHSLGEVAYHAAGRKATHESYMRELGAWSQCRYPGFSSQYLQVFHALAHDLGFADDFLTGSASILLSAALRESAANAERSEQLTAGYVGDTQNVEKMHTLFKAKRYAEVLAIFNSLRSPHLLSDAQLRLVQLARERAGGSQVTPSQ